MSEKEEKQGQISIAALKSGDRTEFARLVDQYSTMIYRLGMRILNNPQDAEDALQETFLKAFRSISNFKEQSSISTWLYRIATNEALMMIRRRKPEINQVDLQKEDDGETYESLEIIDWENLPEDRLLSGEVMDMLDESVQKLTPALRVVFVLRDIEGLSVSETAEILGLSEGAVKTRLSRARMQLRQELSLYFGSELEKENDHEKNT
jgi:RNA polymerase sigma-70 factor (ECF subfamily)